MENVLIDRRLATLIVRPSTSSVRKEESLPIRSSRRLARRLDNSAEDHKQCDLIADLADSFCATLAYATMIYVPDVAFQGQAGFDERCKATKDILLQARSAAIDVHICILGFRLAL